MIPIIIVIILIVINGLFVAAEFALIGAPRTAIERRAKLGHKVAQRLHKILTDRQLQDRYIATAQLGITVSSLGLGMYGEHLFAVWLESKLSTLPLPSWLAAHTIASLTAIMALTYLHIVLGEMIPKSLALQNAEKTALQVTPVMQLIQTLFQPIVILLNGIGNFSLKLLGLRSSYQSHDLYHTQEELEFVIRESQEGGLLRTETGKVLQDLLEFGDRLARETMVPRVKISGIPIGTNTAELVKILSESKHTRYPLYEGDLDHIVGVIHTKDFLRQNISGRAIERSDARPVPYLPESATLEQVLNTMHQENAQMVIVMDEYGGTAGLVTIEDLFEEIIGEIEEVEGGSSALRLKKDGSISADGLVRLDELSEKLGLDVEHDEVDTVGGLVLALLSRPPVPKDVVEYRGARFIVKKVEGHSVVRCVVCKINKT